MAKRLSWLLAGCLVAGAALAADQWPEPKTDILVSVDWLVQHLNDKDLVVVQVGRDRTSYDAGHIPTARFLSWDAVAVERDGVPNELPPVADVARAFSAIGVGDEQRVVLYDDGRGVLAARTWMALDVLGHGDRAAVLNGGLKAWQKTGLFTSVLSAKPEPTTFTPHLREGVLVTTDEVARVSAELVAGRGSQWVLIDARAPEQYAGTEQAEGVSRPGHIPGAVNLWSAELQQGMDEPLFLAVHELRSLFTEVGATPDKQSIDYCRTGVEASLVYVAARVLGLQPKFYDGSYIEWSRDPGRPVLAGASPDGKAPARTPKPVPRGTQCTEGG